MVSLLKGALEVHASTVSIKLESSEEADRFTKKGDPISYFLDRGETEVARRIALNQVTPALFGEHLADCFEVLCLIDASRV